MCCPFKNHRHLGPQDLKDLHEGPSNGAFAVISWNETSWATKKTWILRSVVQVHILVQCVVQCLPLKESPFSLGRNLVSTPAQRCQVTKKARLVTRSEAVHGKPAGTHGGRVETEAPFATGHRWRSNSHKQRRKKDTNRSINKKRWLERDPLYIEFQS